eukprot:365414-Chlamydomonas_euryale.AAC.1
MGRSWDVASTGLDPKSATAQDSPYLAGGATPCKHDSDSVWYRHAGWQDLWQGFVSSPRAQIGGAMLVANTSVARQTGTGHCCAQRVDSQTGMSEPQHSLALGVAQKLEEVPSAKGRPAAWALLSSLQADQAPRHSKCGGCVKIRQPKKAAKAIPPLLYRPVSPMPPV